MNGKTSKDINEEFIDECIQLFGTKENFLKVLNDIIKDKQIADIELSMIRRTFCKIINDKNKSQEWNTKYAEN